MKIFFYETVLGKIGIAEEEGKITNLCFESDKKPENAEICETQIIKEAARQLKCYFSGTLREFSLQLNPQGTEFMKKVWGALCRIPYGQTASYKEIAVAVGNKNAMRAVGMANGRNPIPIFIPCHRVIGADGRLVGYSSGLDIKKKLLDLEKSKK
ncbi:MAG: methylated-DNA--[protein]-cysteine S-methyltransferase [Candidatus Wallbacteria bacterium]